MALVGLLVGMIVVLVVVVILALLFLRQYADTRDKNKPLAVITATSIALPCACLLIVPFDIYNVSSGTNDYGIHTDMDSVEEAATLMKTVYYMLYSMILLWAFFVLPLSLFFFKQEPDMQRSSPDRSQLSQPLKKTTPFVLALVTVIVIGILIADVNTSRPEDWLRFLASTVNMGDCILIAVVGMLHFAGLFGWMMYGSFGLAHLPSVLFQQTQARIPVADDEAEIDRNLQSDSKS